MLHRLIVIGIVGFWLAMTGLLVVRELYPESTRLNAVPISYVGQLLFQHEQASELQIRSGSKVLGYLELQPRTDALSGRRTVGLSGSVSLALSGDPQQRLLWHAVLDLSRSSALEHIRLDLTPPERSQSLHIDVDLIGKKATFGAKVGKEVVNETTVTLDQKGFDSLMATAGVDPALMQQFKASRGEIPEFSFGAQSSSTVLGGQKLSTFLLTLKAGDQVLFEAHMSQLGQVLCAQAPLLGWTLMPSHFTP
jgi:hypothetical protein